LKCTRSQTTSDLNILNWKFWYDVTLFMCQNFKLEIFIWRHIVYVPKSFNNRFHVFCVSHIVYKQVHSAYEYIITSGMSTADLTALDDENSRFIIIVFEYFIQVVKMSLSVQYLKSCRCQLWISRSQVCMLLVQLLVDSKTAYCDYQINNWHLQLFKYSTKWLNMSIFYISG
jgi:hypothetical protein